MDSNESALMKEFADNLSRYVEKRVSDKMSDTVRFFRAEVTTAPANGVVGVTKPYDSEVKIPYVSSLADGLNVGTSVMVLVLGEDKGNLKNAFVFTNMSLSNL